MKITLFTANKNRHNYFINLLSEVAEELFVVQECGTIMPVPNNYYPSPIMEKYFKNVLCAQEKLFGNSYVNNKNSNIKTFPMLYGDLNKCSMNFLEDFLESDIFVVFGSSYIKGDLINLLIKKNAINIHAGISPYYRGSACNFWALYDDNPHLVGATIHLLSKGLDNGPILYHAISNLREDPFIFTMSTIKSAFHSISDRINDGSILKIKPIIQDKSKELRYSKKNEFNEEIIENYFKKDIKLGKMKYEKSMLKDPYIL